MVVGISILLLIGFNRIWKQLRLKFYRINIDIITTVETLYGDMQGGRKVHNTEDCSKKGYQPVICFIAQTAEYLFVKRRKDKTISGQRQRYSSIKSYLPGCVQQALPRADGRFFSRDSIQATLGCAFDLIIGNKSGKPPFNSLYWYRARQGDEVEFNSCIYQSMRWGRPCRLKDQNRNRVKYSVHDSRTPIMVDF